MNAERRLVLAALLFCRMDGVSQAEGFAGLGDTPAGFEAVVPGKPLVFPRDYGPHPGFRTEWWYLTVNLKGADGLAYGAQWTLFRQASEPDPERPGWANRNIFMGHAALTRADEHLYAESFARGGVGQAGVVAAPFRAWIDDWSFESVDRAAEAGLAKSRVSAKSAQFGYRLDVTAEGPLVLHGDKGFSQKSSEGQASYYFSQPFFAVQGVVTLHGQEVKVAGRGWMDHEWSSQPLSANQKGWDWFSLHLPDGAKLMLFRLRGAMGRDYLAGTWIGADGAARGLIQDDIALTPLARTSLAGRTLPIRWRAQVKSLGLDIETTPLNAGAWMGARFPYWEGPISFRGSHEGEGYLEMTGY